MAESDDLDAVMGLAMAKADVLRGAGLEGLQGVTQARQAALEREQARLTQKLGADHPATQVLRLRLATGVTRLRELGVEIARARTPAPEPGEDGWVLHGYVRQKDLSPAPDLTVSMVDERGEWLRALGFACTDAKGYFRLAVKAPPPAGEGPGAPGGHGERRDGLEGYVRVSDGNRVQLHRGDEALSISAGRVEYRDIALNARAGARCVSPEQGQQPSGPQTSKPEGGEPSERPAPKETPRPPGRGQRRK